MKSAQLAHYAIQSLGFSRPQVVYLTPFSVLLSCHIARINMAQLFESLFDYLQR